MDGRPVGEVVMVADGVRALRIERRSVLPSRLDTLLSAMTLRRSRPTVILGTRRACVDGEHERRPWVTGVYAGLELRLDLCPFCGGVEVRDVSLDVRAGIKPGGQGPRRRSDVLGWYSGRRPAGRAHL